MEYRRVISYLYEYHGRTQGKNVGFVRLEVRNGQCRLRIFLKGDVEGQKVGRAEMFRCGREPGQIFLGTMPVRASGAEGAFLTQAQNIAGSGLPLGEFCGIGVFPDGSGKKYFSFWDERRPWEEEEAENSKNADEGAPEPRREPEQPLAENVENPGEGQQEPAVLDQGPAGEPLGSVEQEQEGGQRMEPGQEAEGTRGGERVAEQENSRRESSLSRENEEGETPLEGTPERSRRQGKRGLPKRCRLRSVRIPRRGRRFPARRNARSRNRCPAGLKFLPGEQNLPRLRSWTEQAGRKNRSKSSRRKRLRRKSRLG